MSKKLNGFKSVIFVSMAAWNNTTSAGRGRTPYLGAVCSSRNYEKKIVKRCQDSSFVGVAEFFSPLRGNISKRTHYSRVIFYRINIYPKRYRKISRFGPFETVNTLRDTKPTFYHLRGTMSHPWPSWWVRLFYPLGGCQIKVCFVARRREFLIQHVKNYPRSDKNLKRKWFAREDNNLDWPGGETKFYQNLQQEKGCFFQLHETRKNKAKKK